MNTKPTYLDHGATSFPKAPGVAESMSDYLLNVGCNVNRGAYSFSYQAENIVYETRELLCRLFHFDEPEQVVFTKNITESMNVLIKGLLQEGDHVIVSSMEHNAVMRPLNALKNVSFSRVPCNSAGELQTEKIRALIRPKTKAVIMTHASNVCGTILELEKVGSICKEYNLFFMIDTAQTAGFIDVDFNKLQADAIAFTGHKSLLGPQGIGGFLANKRTTSLLKPLIDGGTGSLSDSEFQPEYMPDKFEAGTLNIPGIYGLHAALNYLFETGISTIREKERMLLNAFLEGTSKIKALNPIGQPSIEKRTAIASVDFPTLDNGMIAHELSKKYGILTRSGLHCAPSAHKTLGTFPKGTVRFSFGHFNTIDDIQYTLNAIRTITDC